MTKEEIRDFIKSKRRELTKNIIAEKSRIITDTVFQLSCYKAAKTVMTYISSFNEPSTFEIIRDVIKHKQLVVPVSNTDDFTIIPSYLRSENDLVKGAYGIYEPKKILSADISSIDIALIPGIAFDRTGARTGFGKGYYDKFLSDFSGVKIGICYDFQLFDEIPSEKHDIRMDMIISEKGIYNDF